MQQQTNVLDPGMSSSSSLPNKAMKGEECPSPNSEGDDDDDGAQGDGDGKGAGDAAASWSSSPKENDTCEFTYEGESGLGKQWQACKKNPGHSGFIPIGDFQEHHLLEQYTCDNDDIYNCIKSISDLTVRVAVSYVSPARPTTFPGAGRQFHNAPYPFHNPRDRKGLRTGSGWITEVHNVSPGIHTCPCDSCKESESPTTHWGGVVVRTAKHVVFDTEEARNTTIALWYDSNLDLENDRARFLTGLSVVSGDIDDDRCEFTCVTHDLELLDKLEEMCYTRNDIYYTVCETYPDGPRKSYPLAVIVSHPHGRAKHITIGKWHTRREVGAYAPDPSLCVTEYEYDTPTCPGSSGAPVFILGRVGLGSGTHPHSCGTDRPDRSRSGAYTQMPEFSLYMRPGTDKHRSGSYMDREACSDEDQLPDMY